MMAEMWNSSESEGPPEPFRVLLPRLIGARLGHRYRSRNTLLHQLGLTDSDYREAMRGGPNALVVALKIARAQSPLNVQSAEALVVRACEFEAVRRHTSARPSKLLTPLYDRSAQSLWLDKQTDWDDFYGKLTMTGTEPSGDNINRLVDNFVELPRGRHGEARALRHALVLLQRCLRVWDSNHADSTRMLLTALQTTRDLAAQLNEVFLQTEVICILEDQVAPALRLRDVFSRHVCERMINLCKSMVIAQSLNFSPFSREAQRAYQLALRATNHIERPDPSMDLGRAWPRLQLSLPSVAFYAAMMAIAAGRARLVVDRHLSTHNRIAEQLDPNQKPVDSGRVTSSNDVHQDDFLISLFLHRPSSDRTFEGPPRSDADWSCFDLEKAIQIGKEALAGSAVNNNAAATARASLRFGMMEAIICLQHQRYGGRLVLWDEQTRQEYLESRQEAKEIYSKLGMRAKLKKMNLLETNAEIGRWAGIDAS